MRALSLTLILCLMTLPAIAADIKVDTTLKGVTIYSGANGRAAPSTLSRSGYIQVAKGKHTLVFENMPANLFVDSLKTEARGTASAVLGAVSTKIVNNVELVSTREKELNAQKEELEKQKKTIKADIEALNKKQEFLDALNKQAIVKIREDVTEFDLNTAQWVSAANVIHESNAEILKETLAKMDMIADIDKQIAKIDLDIRQLRTGQKQSREVRLPVEVTKSGYLTVSIDYQINGVSWAPIYDARLETQSGALELVQYGAVRQNTGEDWKDIELTLSTAQPNRGATSPHLSPMWVDIQRIQALRAQGQSFSNIAENMSASSMDMAAPKQGSIPLQFEEPEIEDPLERWRRSQEERVRQQNAVTTSAELNNNGFNAEFKIAGLVSIPADGTETKVLISPFELETKLERHIKPQASNNAFLVANSTLKGETPLLAGPVSLFRDGSYIGKTNIPMINSGKDYDLSFGIDDQIDVAYKTLKDESSEGGVLIGKTKKIERETITEIQSLRKEPVDIKVFQTLPVSKNEDIEIKISENTTKGYAEDHDNIKGLTVWSASLQPQEEKDITLGWSVAWPKDENITGLR